MMLIVVALSSNVSAIVTSININSPSDGATTNQVQPQFNFTPISSKNVTFTCQLIVNSVLQATNNSIQNNTATILITNSSYPSGIVRWYLNCSDVDGLSYTVARYLTINSPPTLNFTNTTTVSGGSNKNYLYANVTALDNDLTNLTLIFYNSTGGIMNQTTAVTNGTLNLKNQSTATTGGSRVMFATTDGRTIIDGGGTIDISRDYGYTWNIVNNGTFTMVTMNPTGQYCMGVKANGGIWRSNDSCRTFYEVNSLVKNWSYIACDETCTNIVAVAGVGVPVQNGSLFVSNNGGVSFTDKSIMGQWRKCAVSYDGMYMGCVMANGNPSTKGRIYRSNNTGSTWAIADSGDVSYDSISMSSDGLYWYVTGGGTTKLLFRSNNSGLSYSVIYPPDAGFGAWGDTSVSADGRVVCAIKVSGGIAVGDTSGGTTFCSWSYGSPQTNWTEIDTRNATIGQGIAVSGDGKVIAWKSSTAPRRWLYSRTNQLTLALNVTGLSDSTYSFSALSYDDYNNTGYSETRNVTIDGTKPSILFNSDTDVGGSFKPSNVLFANITVSDSSLSNITFYIYNSTNGLVYNQTNTTTGTHLYSVVLPNGLYKFNATARDVAGNINSTETRNVTLDNIYPVYQWNANSEPNNTFKAQNYLQVNITVNDTNFANLTVYLYNFSSTSPMRVNTSTSSTYFINYTNLAQETIYYYNATFIDRAGNINFTDTRKVIISTDTIAPILTYASPSDNSGSLVNRRYIVTNVSVSEANLKNVTTYIYYDGLLNQSSSSTTNPLFANFTVTADGVYYFNSTAYDNIGNYNWSETRNVTIDATYPTIQYQAGTETDNATLDRNYIQINVSGADNIFKNLTIFLYNNMGSLVNSQTTTSTQLFANFTGLNDDTFRFNATACDMANNCISTSTLTVTISTDSIPPTTQFVSPTDTNNGYYNRNYVQINVTASDLHFANLTLFLFNSTGSQLFANTTTQNQSFMNYTALEDGIYRFNATATDTNNNKGYTETRTVTIDTLNPFIEYNLNTDSSGTLTNRNYIIINTTVSDTNLQTTTHRIYNSSGALVNSGASGSTTYNSQLSLPYDGLFYFNATVTDLAGNTNSTETRNLSFDGTMPIIQFISPTEISGSYLERNYVQVNVSIIEPHIANQTIYLFNSSGSLINSSFSTSNEQIANFTDLIDGIYYFNVSSCDIYANCNNTLTRNVTIDTTYPIIQFISPTENDGENLTLRTNILINVSASDTNLKNITIRLYNSSGSRIRIDTTTASTLFVNYTSLADDTYTFNATTYDLAGNVNNTETRTVNVSFDNIVPTISYGVNTDSNNAYYVRDYVRINVTASDQHFDYQTIYLYNSSGSLINNQTTNSTNNFANFTGLVNGVYRFNATAWDLNGNNNSVATRTVTLDTVNPSIIFNSNTDSNDTAYNRNYVIINTTASDTNLQSVTQRVYNSSGSLVNSASGGANLYSNLTVPYDGTFYVNATVTDLAGNVNFTETRTLYLDGFSPIVSFVSPTDISGSFVNRPFILINVTASDLNYVNLTVDLFNLSGVYQSNSTLDTSIYLDIPVSDGFYLFNATAYDTFNNGGISATRNVTVDMVNPAIIFELDTQADNSFIDLDYLFANVSASDTNFGNLTLQLYTGGNLFFNQTTFLTNTYANITGLLEGIYLLNATAYDLAGNVNFTETRTIVVDMTDPMITFLSGTDPDDSYLNRDYVVVSVTTIDDNFANVTFRLYNVTGDLVQEFLTTSDTYEYNFTNLTDGVYYFNATALDKVGHSDSTATRMVTIITSLPTLEFVPPTLASGSIINYSYIEINISSNTTNLKNLSIMLYDRYGLIYSSISGNDSVLYNNFSGLPDQLYFYNATACNLAGNCQWSDTRNITVAVDTVPPIISYDSMLSGYFYADTIFLNVSASDNNLANITGYIYEFGGLTYFNSTIEDNLFFSQGGLGDGIYYVNASAIDDSENLAWTSTRTIILDTTSPIIDYNLDTEIDGSSYNRASLFVNVTANDTNLANITINIYNSSGALYDSQTSYSPIFAYNFTIMVEDTYYFNATVFDFVGLNTSTDTRSVNITLDFLPPILQYRTGTDTDNSYVNIRQVKVNVSGADPNWANMTIHLYNSSGSQIDSVFTNETDIYHIFNVSADGVYRFNVTSIDTYNQSSSLITRTVIVDTLSPIVQLVSPSDISGSLVNRLHIIINSTASDLYQGNITNSVYNSSGWLVNTATVSGYSLYSNLSLPYDGLFYFNATAIDLAGNTNYSVTRNITVDTSAPMITFVSPSDNDNSYVSRSYVVVNISASDNYFANMTIYLYNASTLLMANFTTSSNLYLNYLDLSDGVYYVNVTSFDALGNSGTSTVRTITVDTTYPVVVVSDDSINGYSPNSQLTVTTNITDANCYTGVMYGYNASNNIMFFDPLLGNTCYSTTSTSSLNDGVYHYNATVTDRAGNTNNSNVGVFVIDTIDPSIDYLVNADGNNSVLNRKYIQAGVFDSDINHKNLSTYLYNASGSLINYQTTSSTTLPSNYTVLDDGYYYFNATACDMATNCNSTPTRTVFIDSITPTMAYVSPTTPAGTRTDRTIKINVSGSDKNLVSMAVTLYKNGVLEYNATSNTTSIDLEFNNLVNDVYTFNGSIVDIAGNVFNLGTRQVIMANQPPTIYSIHTNKTGINIDTLYMFNNFYFKANVSDPEGDPFQVHFTITFPNNLTYNYSGVYSEGVYWTSIPFMAFNGTYVVTVYANDGFETSVYNKNFSVSDVTTIYTHYQPIIMTSGSNTSFDIDFVMNTDEVVQFYQWCDGFNESYFTCSFSSNPVNILYNGTTTVTIQSSGITPTGNYSGVLNTNRTIDGRWWSGDLPISIAIAYGQLEVVDKADWSVSIPSDGSANRLFILRNIGTYNLTNCNAVIDGGFYDWNFITFSHYNFSLGVGQNLSFRTTFTDPPQQTYRGYLNVLCTASADNLVNSIPFSNRPYVQLVSTIPIPPQGGGGGGGSPQTVIVLRSSNNQSLFSITTDSGSTNSVFFMYPSQIRKETLVLTSSVGQDVIVNLACQGTFCQYITFDSQTVKLYANTENQIFYTLSMPDNIPYGTEFSYKILVSSPDSPETAVLTSSIIVSKLSSWYSKFALVVTEGDVGYLTKIGTFNVPKIILYLLLVIISELVTYAIFPNDKKWRDSRTLTLLAVGVGVFLLASVFI
jgi:hypothetical protein